LRYFSRFRSRFLARGDTSATHAHVHALLVSAFRGFRVAERRDNVRLHRQIGSTQSRNFHVIIKLSLASQYVLR
jgi:hypothetical protein